MKLYYESILCSFSVWIIRIQNANSFERKNETNEYGSDTMLNAELLLNTHTVNICAGSV